MRQVGTALRYHNDPLATRHPDTIPLVVYDVDFLGVWSW